MRRHGDATAREPPSIGIYVHVPFCRRKCRYCDFYSRPPDGGEVERFVAAVPREIDLRPAARHDTEALRAVTVYFGGGTPSMLDARQLAVVLGAIRARFRVAPDAEITIEANPLDVTPDWAARCLDAGFNRISIGVQGIIEDDLRFLGRLHGAADGPDAVAIARRAGFHEIGIDLIYGLPGQTSAAVRESVIRAVESCRPQHVSCYQLTFAEDTPLGRDLRAGRIRRLSENEEYDLFIAVHETMDALGYPAYEVSNFSLTDAHRSRHNSNYWRQTPYIGLGPGAHSFAPPMRSWNVASVTDYLAAVDGGAAPVVGTEELSPEQLAAEMVMLALRTTDGLDLRLLSERFGLDLLGTAGTAVRAAAERGLVSVSPDRIRPTTAGLAVADRLAAEFLP